MEAKAESKKTKTPRKPGHPSKGGRSKYSFFAAFLDHASITKLSVPYPEDLIKELSLLKERIVKYFRVGTLKCAYIYDNYSNVAIEYMSREGEWRPIPSKKETQTVYFHIQINYNDGQDAERIRCESQQELEEKMDYIKRNFKKSYKVVLVFGKGGMLYYWHHLKKDWVHPEKNETNSKCIIQKSHYRMFLISIDESKTNYFTVSTKQEIALEEIKHTLHGINEQLYRVVQVYRQTDNALIYHSKYGNKVMDIIT